VAILGAGEQARYHAAVLRALNPACEVVAYDPVRERAARLCDGVIVAADPVDAVAGAHVVITSGPIIKDPKPALSLEILPNSCLLLPIDFDFYVQARVVQEANRFVVDDIDQFEHYVSLGYFRDWPAPVESLGHAVDSPGHAGRVVCANLGVGALDAAFANAVTSSSALADTT
jgi:ornithine cyclodeaminase/alanine dehydrogenase-like protein (mu-crystallin family)